MIRKLRSVSVLGWGFLALGILGNPWAIAAEFTPDGRLDFHVRTALLIVDGLFLFWGVVILVKRHTRQGRHIGYLVVTTVIILAVVESGLQVVGFIKNWVVPDILMRHSAYRNEPWGRQLWTEYRSTTNHYVPFIVWQANEIHGQWVNIDHQGLRKTWTPPGGCGPAPKQIFVIGGSAVWGIGARDDYTIPSDLSKLLNARSPQYLVTNYGTPGFTLLQEVIKLTLLLKDGRRPDYVVFYDGANDVYSAYQAGRVVNLLDFKDIQAKVEDSPLTLGARYLFTKCRTIQATEKALALFRLTPNYREGAAQFTEAQLGALGKEIAANYKSAAVLVQKLSEVYEFNYTLFWQPVIFTEINVVEDEVKFDHHSQDKNLAKLFKMVVANVAQSPRLAG